jgi:hypothetical protein
MWHVWPTASWHPGLQYEQLVKHLTTHGYAPCTHTPGMWTHIMHGINFCLVIDDFSIKYTDRANDDYLLTALGELHQVTTDRDGTLFLDMTIAWDYTNTTINIYIPGYIAKALNCFQHHVSSCAKHSPHPTPGPNHNTA